MRSQPSASATGASGTLRLDDGSVVELRLPAPAPAPRLDERAVIVAEAPAGTRVGGATYDRVYGPRAAVTLWVDDAYWSRGLPEALLGTLRLHAARAGISTLLMQVPAHDERMRALLTAQFGAREVRGAGAQVELELATERATT